MKNKIIKGIAFFIILGTITFAGCAKKTDNISIDQTSYYTFDIDGEYIYLDESEAKVSSAKKTSEEFIKARLVRDYKNLDVKHQYTFMIKELYKKYSEDTEEIKSLERYYEENKVIQQCDGMETKEIRFYNLNDNEECEVKLTYKERVVNSSQEYLKNNNLKLNVPYESNIIISMKIEDDVWKVYKLKYEKKREEINE